MFSVHCPQCSRKSFSAGTPRCFHCGSIETRTNVGDNFNSTDPEAPTEHGAASGSKSYVLPDDLQMYGVVHSNDRKIYQSNDRMIINNSEDHKRCRIETDSIWRHILPTYSEQGGMNDFPLETLKASHIEVDLPMQKQCNVKKTFQQSSSSNLFNFQSTENENPRLNIPNIEVSARESKYTIYKFFAVPNPSGFQDKKNTSHSSEEEFPSSSSLELQPALETHKTTSLCGICICEMDKHCFEDQGKTLYKCCECKNVFSRNCDLHKHTITHRPYFLPCNICGEFIFDNDAHDKEETCNVCLEKFKCRTQLEQHTLIHRDYYNSNCRVCGTEINVLFDPLKDVYNCCHCHYSNPRRRNLQDHLYKHTYLKIFKCDVCGRRFKFNSSLTRHLHLHFRCQKCSNSFTDSEYLEMHLKEEHAQPQVHSRIKKRQAVSEELNWK